MFHVQTLCRQALWIHHGRAQMYGNAFDVTREYLTYHEEKRQKEAAAPRPVLIGPKVQAHWIENGAGKECREFEMGEDIVVQAIIHEPDDRPPVMMLGIVRVDGTPVYGTHSNDTPFEPRRIAPNRFAFTFRLRGAALIPGKYTIGTHALDAEGLRLFHSDKIEVVVTGKTRDYGVVRLVHEWLPGRDGKP
jgi:lipopolysaccharide transport system ATP-binding protein